MASSMSYEKIITTKPFTFILGSERTVMIVHSGMVAHHSAVLQKLVDGDMAEATTGVATLVDVDPGTFSRFSQWGYTGDYTVVHPEILLDSSMIGTGQSDTNTKFLDPKRDDVAMVAPPEVVSPSEEDSFVDFSPRSYRARPKKRFQNFQASEPASPAEAPSTTPKNKAWLEFQLSSPKDFISRKEGAHVNSEHCEDYTEVFLCHARLYVFAEKYDIQPLRKLSKHNMHRLLSNFCLYTERVGDIVALLRYVYENTPHRAHMRDELRDLVMQYIVCQYDKMACSEGFLDLMEEGGACIRDCLSMLSSIVE